MTETITQYCERSCSCESCRDCCKRPCLPLPAEVEALIAAGFAERLMLDWWCGNFSGNADDYHDTYVISPANPGYEGERAPEGSLADSIFGGGALRSGCTFLTVEGKCEIHDPGLKPFEGRVAMGAAHDDRIQDFDNVHEHVARAWDTEEGRRVVELWKRKVDYP